MSVGFHRLRPPQRLFAQVAHTIQFPGARQDAAFIARTIDPFGIDDCCEASPSGMHRPVDDRGDVACRHCSKVFWR